MTDASAAVHWPKPSHEFVRSWRDSVAVERKLDLLSVQTREQRKMRGNGRIVWTDLDEELSIFSV